MSISFSKIQELRYSLDQREANLKDHTHFLDDLGNYLRFIQSEDVIRDSRVFYEIEIYLNALYKNLSRKSKLSEELDEILIDLISISSEIVTNLKQGQKKDRDFYKSIKQLGKSLSRVSFLFR